MIQSKVAASRGAAFVTTYTSSSLTLRAILKSAAGQLGMGVPKPADLRTQRAGDGDVRGGRSCAKHHVLIVPSDADVERATSDARFFLAALEGLSDTDVERVVLPFPSHEVDPYRGLAPAFRDRVRPRAHAACAGLGNCASGDRVRRGPVAESQRHRPNRDDRCERCCRVRTSRPTDLGDLFAAAGYTRQDPVDESGEFCIRGGVVDFFPAGAKQPIRLEFVGDTIESIRSYDPSTQRSIGGPRSGRRDSAAGTRSPGRETTTAAPRSSTTCRLPDARRYWFLSRTRFARRESS